MNLNVFTKLFTITFHRSYEISSEFLADVSYACTTKTTRYSVIFEDGFCTGNIFQSEARSTGLRTLEVFIRDPRWVGVVEPRSELVAGYVRLSEIVFRSHPLARLLPENVLI